MTALAVRELVIERDFAAPRELVFKAWTEPARFLRWWGPRGCTMISCEIDPRPGGSFQFRQAGPGLGEISCRAIYREFAAPERLAWAWSFVDASGNVIRHPGEPEWPLETFVAVTFADLGAKTRMTLHHTLATTDRLSGMAAEGWASCFGLLDEYLATP